MISPWVLSHSDEVGTVFSRFDVKEVEVRTNAHSPNSRLEEPDSWEDGEVAL